MLQKITKFFLITALLTIFCSSCCSLPETNHLIKSEKGKLKIIEVEKDKPHKNLNNNSDKLPQSFEVLSWNGLAGYRKIFKRITGLKFEAFECDAEKWDKVFYELSKDKDIVLIQEAYLDNDFLELIDTFDSKYSLNMAKSFESDDSIPNGVLTMSTADAESAYPMLACEPVLPTPKSALLTTFGFKNDDSKQLLVVNIHAILMGSQNFKCQLKNIKEAILNHSGPVILAGDFNTMSEDRTDELNIFTKDEDEAPNKLLEKVPLSEDKRIKLFGYPIDFIFCRGLTVEKAYAIDLETQKGCKVSDHNPIIVKFRLKK